MNVFRRVRGSECLRQFVFFQSPQNFFQIISNLLEEENKEKWEDAQKVSRAACTAIIDVASLAAGEPVQGPFPLCLNGKSCA